jgi:putative ABC transport system permease protein
VVSDIRYALRTMLRAPGFAATAALTLAIGIGANTAIFTVVYALLLKPLPFHDAERLIYVHDTFPAVANASVSMPKFVALRDGNRSLSSLAATSPASLTVTGIGDPQILGVTRVSGDFFDVLGVAPLAGRTITRADDVPGAAAVIVLTYGAWQRLFGGARDIVGRTIIADGQPRAIIGVMPPDLVYPARYEAWVPLALARDALPGNNFLRIVGRLKPGVSIEQATADLDAVTTTFNAQSGQRRGIRVWPLHEYLAQNTRQMVLVLQGAVLLVLLVACANVANMLLARSVPRQRELAIRMAIGASPRRLLRQLLTESLLLAVAGGALGVLLGGWLLRLFVALAPPGFSGVQAIAIDRHVLWFTAAVAMLTGVVFGVAPARRGFRIDANDGLRDATGRGSASAAARGASRALVIAEVGLAMVLVIGAGLLVKSLLRLQAQDAGFRAEGLLTFQINLPRARYDDNALRRAVSRIVEAMRALPGVSAAGAINFLPLQAFGFNGPFAIDGRPPLGTADRPPVVEYRTATAAYFQAMQIPLRRGALFTDRDSERTRPVVVISETMARQFWPDENPVGARVRLGFDANQIVREVIGVVGDVRSQALSQPPASEAYIPYAQAPLATISVAVRAAGDPAALLPAIRQRIAAVDASLAVIRTQTMVEVVDASTGSMRLASTLTSVFAALAALLAAVGIYSLVSYSVASRTREIGIRVALGAHPASVLRLVVGEGMKLTAIGLALGVAGTWWLTGTLRSLLFEVSPVDPAVLAATAAAVVALTTVASLVPAWRVMRVDPTTALRSE